MRLRSESDTSLRVKASYGWKNERKSWLKIIVYNSPVTVCLQIMTCMVQIVQSYFTNLQNVFQIFKST